MKHSICAPLFRSLRKRRVMPFIKDNYTVLDLGCGFEGTFLKSIAPYIKQGIGIDKKGKPFQQGNITIQEIYFDGVPLEFEDESFDCVTMLAVLEHLNHREEILKEIHRVLIPGGVALLTTPTWAGKPVLEFLAYHLKIVSEEEIRDHKIYFWKKELRDVLLKAGFKREKIELRYFELGFNVFAAARK